MDFRPPIQQKRRQQTLLLVFVSVLIITGVVLWMGLGQDDSDNFSANEDDLFFPPQVIALPPNVFELPIFKELESVPDPILLPKEVGRENPFLP